MTKKHFLECIKDVPDDAIIMATDPEEGGVVPITSLLIWPGTARIKATVEVFTSEP